MRTLLKRACTAVLTSALGVGTLGSPAFAKDAPGDIGEDLSKHIAKMPDFSYAGYGFGTDEIPHYDTVIDVADFGAVPDDGKDDSVALKAALAAAGDVDGPVRVQMHAGRYVLTEILWVDRGEMVLSGMGSGPGGTQLYMPRPLNQMDDNGVLDELREYLKENDKYERQPDANLNVLFSEYSWSGGFIWVRPPDGRAVSYLKSYDREITEVTSIRSGKQFERELVVDNAASLKVGDVFQIHWHNRAGPDGPLIKSIYGETDLKIGSRHWESPDQPLVRQATRIEKINGNRIVIADPLLHAIDDQLPAYFAQWDHLSDVGLQDFAMVFPENPFFGHHNEAGYNGIYFTGVHNGWMRNLHITNADAGIMTDDTASISILNVVTDGTHRAHYSVHIGKVHNALVDGLQVINPTEHTFSFNTRSTRSVYKNSIGWNKPTLDQHAGANHQNLYDNVTVRIRPDQTTKDGKPLYDLFLAGGAGYWQPGHGRFNTVWNLKVLVEGGVAPGEAVTIYGGSEGPDARIIGMHGNRPLELEYIPTPYVALMNDEIITAPSLYDYQLAQRLTR